MKRIIKMSENNNYRDIISQEIDQSILASGFNMAISGESREKIIKAMRELGGWSQEKAEFMYAHIMRYVPEEKQYQHATQLGFIATLIVMTMAIFIFGDYFFKLPEEFLSRLLVSMGYTAGVVASFAIVWVFFALIISEIGGER